MAELLRDPLWQFVGVILAVFTIGVSILIYQLQRTRKSLSYDILSNTPLLTMKEELEGKLQILYEGTPVTNVQLMVVKIVNSGNMPITTSDYERPLRFVFEDKARILSAEITERVPENLLASVTINQNSFELGPTLLNGKDSIMIKALVNDYTEKPKADARIVGVKRVRPASDVQIGSFLLMLVGLASLLIGMFVFFRIIISAKTPDEIPSDRFVLSLGLLLFGYITSFIAMFRTKRYRKLFLAILRGHRNRRDTD